MRRKPVSLERPVSFSAEDIARAGGALGQRYRDGRPFVPVADDTVPTPYLTRLQARLAASVMEEERAYLREQEAEDIIELMERAGGPRPTLRWLLRKTTGASLPNGSEPDVRSGRKR
jgi:hypothetical protein